MKQTFTHKGWLGLAPIYLDMDHNVTERPYTGWILTASTWIVQTINDVFDTGYPFPIRITGKLKKPYVLVIEGEE